jgi:molecular chaperone DnaJ
MAADFYEQLGVRPDADAETLKRAYRRKAKQYHPDSGCGQDGQRFRAIREAYETLGDPARRRRYDAQTGRLPPVGTRCHAVATESPVFSRPVHPPWGWLADMLAVVLDGRAGGGEWELILSPAEARRGGRMELRVPWAVACPRCRGGQWPESGGCPVCGGHGVLGMHQAVALEIPPGVAAGTRVHIPGAPGGSRRQGITLRIRVEG